MIGSVIEALATVRDRLSQRRYSDPALKAIRACETPEQRRVNDRKQRHAEELWQMQYDGPPARDPAFRREERLFFQKRLDRGAESKALLLLWKRYHAKYAAEHPPRKEAEVERRKKAVMLRAAAGPNIPIPPEYRDAELRRPRSFLTEGRERLARLTRCIKEPRGRDEAKHKGAGQGFGP